MRLKAVAAGVHESLVGRSARGVRRQLADLCPRSDRLFRDETGLNTRKTLTDAPKPSSLNAGSSKTCVSLQTGIPDTPGRRRVFSTADGQNLYVADNDFNNFSAIRTLFEDAGPCVAGSPHSILTLPVFITSDVLDKEMRVLLEKPVEAEIPQEMTQEVDRISKFVLS
ncbi:unnamed protein product [Nippostrongylus brasiliensis]|uniref:Uncharacterized protein n=1 Tax=Nippostrongylus brasiliensis TaxID=27835 RepID=A0A0N4Y8N9_NIPBR|nr:unnamed protein product [Nippostrongylus brasiliensis]